MNTALVHAILRNAHAFPWRMSEIGLLALRLDDRREWRLHVWDPESFAGGPPVHDHPYDFASTVIAGEITNTRYEPDPAGEEFVRFRYVPGAEDRRRADRVALSATATTFRAGDEYRQLAPELHASTQLPGTVTVIRCSWVESPELTVCLRDDLWRSEQARAATPDEIERAVANALEWF